MKNCPHCLKALPVKKRKAKKFKLGYKIPGKIKPASNNIHTWIRSGWGVPKRLFSDDWQESPSFSRAAFLKVKGVDPEFYSVERSA